MSKIFSIFLLIDLSINNGALTNNVLSQSDKNALLDLHNDARTKTAEGSMPCRNDQNICPGGTIEPVTWSDTVAKSAQEYADWLQTYCKFEHSDSPYGENLAAGHTSMSYTSICDGWIEPEALKYCFGEGYVSTFSVRGSNEFYEVGHFTQVVSARTTQVGCGCADNTDCTYSRMCVCQYNPGGNMGTGTNASPGGIVYPYSSNSNSKYSCDGQSGETKTTTEKPQTTKEETKTSITPITTDDSNSDTGKNPSIVQIYGFDNFSPLNGVPFNSITSGSYSNTDVTSTPAYGPVSMYGYTFYIYYDTRSWYQQWVLTISGIGSGSRVAYCNTKEQTTITSCSSWNDWAGSSNIKVYSASDSYSSSSSSNDNENELIEGLLIGLGIAIGIFLIALLVYYCIKRKNNQKNQYNVVEMNNNENSISNHEYVTMQN